MDEKGKVLAFNNQTQKYRDLAQSKADEGDYQASLGFLFTALKSNPLPAIYGDIAYIYTEMNLFSLSNDFWFKYLSVCNEKDFGIAYEQIATNFFYMDNVNLSGYYFHKKLEKDGFISKETLDEEIMDFFNQTVDKRSFYHIAYPYEKADYSHKTKLAKQAIATGEYNSAKKIYSTIPEQCLSEEEAGEYAFSLFLSGDDDQMKKVCKNSLENHGENLTAYANLSSLYHAKNDKEKSAYYYAKALELYKGEEGHTYKIATCAMEQNDHLTANSALSKILSDRPNDVTMRFLYGISQLNLGKFKSANATFSYAYRTAPWDKTVGFYAQYASKLEQGDVGVKNYLPLEYAVELPAQVVKNNKKTISELFSGNYAPLGKKWKKYKDVLCWGITQSDYDYARKSVCIVSTIKEDWAIKCFLESLIDKDVDSRIKQMIIGLIILSGYKEKFSAVLNELFIQIKPRKVIFEDKIDGDLFLAAYAVAVSRLAFWNVDEFDKIGFSINKIYKKLHFDAIEMGLSPEELATVTILYSKLPKFSDVAQVCKYMEVKQNKVKECLSTLLGDKDD